MVILGKKLLEIYKEKKAQGIAVDMSDPPGHFVLFCKLQKGGLKDDKKSQRSIENPF